MVENVSSRLFPWFAESSQDQDGDEDKAACCDIRALDEPTEEHGDDDAEHDHGRLPRRAQRHRTGH